MALTQITTNGIKDGSITGTDLTTNVDFVDNQKLRLGTGSDLEIYHDGSHSYIKDTGTGRLILQSSQLCLQSTTGENFLVGNPDAGTELYHNNVKKFETTSNGINVTGRLLATGSSGYGLIFNDDVKISLGSNNDLQIYHDGTNSYIKNLTGYLNVNANLLYLGNQANNETYILAQQNGSVDLYYDNSKKFETTSTGIDVSNILQVGTTNDTGELRIGHDGSSYRARLVSNSSNSLEIDADGPERILMHGGVIYMKPLNSEISAAFVANGAVELYHDSSKKFETMSTGAYVEGYLAFPDNGGLKIGSGNDLQIFHDGSDSYIRNTTNTDLIIHNQGNAGIQIKPQNSYPVELYYNASKKFETTSLGVKFTGTTSHLNWLQGSNDDKLRFNDGVKAVFGNSDDLQIYHDGSNSFLKDTNDYLFISGNNGVVIKTNSAGTEENQIRCINNGAVELYHNNSLKFNTNSGGCNITGSLAFLSESTNISILDNGKAKFGNGDDLQIYHDGSHSYIADVGTGELRLRGTTIRLTDHNGTENFANFIDNGAVELFYDNSKKCETTNSGLRVYGNLDLEDNEKIRIGTGDDLQIFHNGTNSFISNTTGIIQIDSDDRVQVNATEFRVKNAGDTELIAKFIENGAVSLYYDNVMKITTTSSGARVNGNFVINDGSQLQLQNPNANRSSEIANGGSSTNSDLQFRTNGTHRATISSSGHFEPALNNTYDLGTTSYRWRNIYTNDLNLSNEGGANDVDGTWGSYTIQEGAEDLFLVNKRSGKKYKFNLTEVS
nr:endosialidase [uncultured Mediterranean phage uvMED]BAR38711.1 endosialidase [uncultured Mediterranean phage uvMED]